MIEICECMMTYMTDGDIWTCDGWHEWQGYIYMLWFTWVIKVYEYTMNYTNDRDIWICYELHEWQEYMDMLCLT